jgi:hypothetical protein
VFAVPFLVTAPISAQYSSPNYKIDETFFGTGGEVDASSASYRSRQAAGSLGVGNTSSANYDLTAGFITPSEPFLEVFVTGATVDFGDLSESTTSTGEAKAGTCNCSFTVRTYLSSAYVVVTASQPPTSEGGAVLDAKTTLGVPSTDEDVEEFGINLVDNTSPNIGANPLNVPDNSFADGRAADGYNTVNQFKYVPGDVIARSPATVGNPAVGNTDYTIAYIAKKKKLTEAGVFRMSHDIVVVATY